MVLHNNLCSKLSTIVALDAVDQSDIEWNQTVDPVEPEPAEPETASAASFIAANGDRIHRQSIAAQQQSLKAEAEWQAGVAALDDLLRGCLTDSPSSNQACELQGLVLSGPLPILETPAIAEQFSSWMFTTQGFEDRQLVQRQIQPADFFPCAGGRELQILSLLPNDPLSEERFCLALTPKFSLVLVLGTDDEGTARFQFSFSPETVHQIWQVLRSRVALTSSHHLSPLDRLVEQFSPVAPHYHQVVTFSRLLLNHRPEVPRIEIPGVSSYLRRDMVADPATVNSGAMPKIDAPGSDANVPAGMLNNSSQGRSQQPSAPRSSLSPDAELLQVMAHEIRTPLTTIRTLVRSLLRRKDLATAVAKRLNAIDRECTQQIDRFSLIFKAVELEAAKSNRPRSPLTLISLTQVFKDSIPQWEQQANRRGLTLDVTLPSQLPMVASDPTMLTQVLTGLVERCTNGLAPNSHIHLQVMLAGHQLKLQFAPQSPNDSEAGSARGTFGGFHRPSLRSVGQLLMFQPETGGLSLNLNATKNLFQSMGGKLIVRNHPQQGEVLTVFLPLETAPIV
ncbi:MAG: HAMP domain-containing sensor histidine kinase [Cyanobacteria bacterium J06642_9]